MLVYRLSNWTSVHIWWWWRVCEFVLLTQSLTRYTTAIHVMYHQIIIGCVYLLGSIQPASQPDSKPATTHKVHRPKQSTTAILDLMAGREKWRRWASQVQFTSAYYTASVLRSNRYYRQFSDVLDVFSDKELISVLSLSCCSLFIVRPWLEEEEEKVMCMPLFPSFSLFSFSSRTDLSLPARL